MIKSGFAFLTFHAIIKMTCTSYSASFLGNRNRFFQGFATYKLLKNSFADNSFYRQAGINTQGVNGYPILPAMVFPSSKKANVLPLILWWFMFKSNFGIVKRNRVVHCAQI